jgi:hypothetical protein
LSGGIKLTNQTTVTISGAPPSSSGTETLTVNGANYNYSATTSDTNSSIASGLNQQLLNNSINSTVFGPVITITANLSTTYSSSGFGGVSITPSKFAAGGLTLFVVTDPTSLPAGARIFDLGDGASGNNILCQISATGSQGQFSAYSGTSGTNALSASALTANQYQLLAATQSQGATNGTAKFFVNGAAGTANSSMNNFPVVSRTSNFIGQSSGTGSFYPGNICEVLLYSTNLTNQQITAITAALLQKYQVLTQTPETPTISVATGTLSGPTQVAITTQPGTATYITRDGTTPSTSSEVYCGRPITINYTQTIKAIAVKNGIQSGVASATYTLDSTQWPAPNPADMTAPSINLQLPVPSI